MQNESQQEAICSKEKESESVDEPEVSSNNSMFLDWSTLKKNGDIERKILQGISKSENGTMESNLDQSEEEEKDEKGEKGKLTPLERQFVDIKVSCDVQKEKKHANEIC